MGMLKSLFGETKPSFDLTGTWQGHYEQCDRSCPIRARLVQKGTQITGSMEDLEIEFDGSIFELAFYAGLPPGSDEQIDARLRNMFPDAGSAPIRYKSRLSSNSIVEGTVAGDMVRFVKMYQGEHYGGFVVGTREVGCSRPGHSVDYRGQVKDQGLHIEGRWTIVQPNCRLMQGVFILNR
jgi:hypothetical protein